MICGGGVPRTSPALLPQSLKELEAAGIVERIKLPRANSAHEYRLTEAGRDLQSVVETIGIWGRRWVDADLSLENLDPSLLMWDMRRNLDPTPMPKRHGVIEFLYTDLPASQKHWRLIIESAGDVDLCSVDPGFDVDLYVTTKLRSMTSIWMGLTTVRSEQRDKNLELDGDMALASNMQTWLGLSPFAEERKRV